MTISHHSPRIPHQPHREPVAAVAAAVEVQHVFGETEMVGVGSGGRGGVIAADMAKDPADGIGTGLGQEDNARRFKAPGPVLQGDHVGPESDRTVVGCIQGEDGNMPSEGREMRSTGIGAKGKAG